MAIVGRLRAWLELLGLMLIDSFSETLRERINKQLNNLIDFLKVRAFATLRQSTTEQ